MSSVKGNVKIMTPALEQEIVKLYVEGNSAGKVIEKIGNKFKTKKTIYDILKRNGIDRKEHSFYSVANHTAFDNIDTPIKAYILGLMITDGYVVHKGGRSYQVGIQLQESNLKTIELVSELIGGKILVLKNLGTMTSPTTGKEYQRGDMYRSVVDSEYMANQLAQYGVIPRKSEFTYLPILSKEMMPHLIRGLIDGDGYITLAGSGAPLIGLYGTAELIANVTFFLSQEIELTRKHPLKKSPTKFLSHVQWGSLEDAQKMYNYLGRYEPRMERKWKPLQEFLELKA